MCSECEEFLHLIQNCKDKNENSGKKNHPINVFVSRKIVVYKNFL